MLKGIEMANESCVIVGQTPIAVRLTFFYSSFGCHKG